MKRSGRGSWSLDEMEAAGVAVLGVGFIAGMCALVSRMIPGALPLDAAELSVYASIVLVVGIGMLAPRAAT